jgi:hypothetical protein
VKRKIGRMIRQLRKQSGFRTRDSHSGIGYKEYLKWVADLFCEPIRQRMNYIGFARQAFNVSEDAAMFVGHELKDGENPDYGFTLTKGEV